MTIRSGPPAGAYYAFGDGISGGFWLPWLYEESNGLPGLQRLDELRDDTCHGMFAPDTLIF